METCETLYGLAPLFLTSALHACDVTDNHLLETKLVVVARKVNRSLSNYSPLLLHVLLFTTDLTVLLSYNSVLQKSTIRAIHSAVIYMLYKTRQKFNHVLVTKFLSNN